MEHRPFVINLCIVCLGALAFLTGIGSVRLFDWDEIIFAESAREMLVSGDWLNVRINFESFWEKPPLFIWMQALSMRVFGVGEFAARFPNSVMGILTLLLIFNIGRRTKDERFGILWAVMYGVSVLPFFYFKSGLIDPWFNFFIFLGIYFFSRYADTEAADKRLRHAVLSAASIGLAILTKGPVGFLVFGLTFIVWLISSRFDFSFRWGDVAAYVIVLLLVGGSWFAVLALTGHFDVIQDFITYQIRVFQTKDLGHGGFLLYHFVILFFGVAPASVFAIPAFRRRVLRDEGNLRMAGLFKWMMCSFWVVLILFTIVRTKLVHYSSFCYFPLSFLAAYAADRMIDNKWKFRKWQSVTIICIFTLLGLLLTGMTFFDGFKDKVKPYVNDPFAVSCMDASADWMGFEPFVGVILVIFVLWFCISFRRYPTLRTFAIIVTGNVAFLLTMIICAVPEVEKYSQASAVDFYISKQAEDCYICPTYFQTFAHYFYGLRADEYVCDDFDTLSSAPLDKPCYFVLKDIPDDLERFREEVPDADSLYRRSGFVFYRRNESYCREDAKPEQADQEKIEQ